MVFWDSALKPMCEASASGTMDGSFPHSVRTNELSTRKKRGRPRKSDTVLLPGEITALGILPSSDRKSVKPRTTDYDSSQPGQGNISLIGQTVHGVLDGSFDAGYLLTVRVGESDTVFRGVVFRPGLSIPPSKINDIASNVKHTNRDVNMNIYSPFSSPPAPTPVTFSEEHEQFTVTPSIATPAATNELGVSLENGMGNSPQQTECASTENRVCELPKHVAKESNVEDCNPIVPLQVSLNHQAEPAHGDAPTVSQPE